VELRGLEPLTFALPARRSSQLSYSPVEIEVIGKRNACALAVARRRQSKMHLVHARESPRGQQEGSVQLAAVDGEQIDLPSVSVVRT
jgi:hypothetical protein